MVVVGLIGGSGLLKSRLPALQGLAEEQVDTPHGRVFLRTGAIAPGVTLVFVQRHDASPSRVYAQPADINYAAIALALKAKVRTRPPSTSLRTSPSCILRALSRLPRGSPHAVRCRGVGWG